jgi:hypothetical protein
LSNAGWVIESDPGVLWVVLAVCDIFVPGEVDGLVILVILHFWALWSALSLAWGAINMSAEAVGSVASNSVVNINGHTVAVAVVVVVIAAVVIVSGHWCCVGFDTHWFWSVWLNMFVLFRWAVDR